MSTTPRLRLLPIAAAAALTLAFGGGGVALATTPAPDASTATIVATTETPEEVVEAPAEAPIDTPEETVPEDASSEPATEADKESADKPTTDTSEEAPAKDSKAPASQAVADKPKPKVKAPAKTKKTVTTDPVTVNPTGTLSAKCELDSNGAFTGFVEVTGSYNNVSSSEEATFTPSESMDGGGFFDLTDYARTVPSSETDSSNWFYGYDYSADNVLLRLTSGEVVLDELAVDPQGCIAPPDKVEYGEWKDGKGDCETGKVAQTRTVTTTPYISKDGKWVLDTENATVTTGSQTRDMTKEELAACESTEQPADKVVYGTWMDGMGDCETGKVEQARTVTTTPYVLVDGKWVLDTENASVTNEYGSRDMTKEELAECTVDNKPAGDLTVICEQDAAGYTGFAEVSSAMDNTKSEVENPFTTSEFIDGVWNDVLFYSLAPGDTWVERIYYGYDYGTIVSLRLTSGDTVLDTLKFDPADCAGENPPPVDELFTTKFGAQTCVAGLGPNGTFNDKVTTQVASPKEAASLTSSINGNVLTQGFTPNDGFVPEEGMNLEKTFTDDGKACGTATTDDKDKDTDKASTTKKTVALGTGAPDTGGGDSNSLNQLLGLFGGTLALGLGGVVVANRKKIFGLAA